MDIRIGELNPSLDAWLAGLEASSGVFVSAANPASRPLPDDENEVRHAFLCREMKELDYPIFQGAAVADAGDWPVEVGLLVLQVSEARARALGRDYDQNAVVWVALGEAPRLLWCLKPE